MHTIHRLELPVPFATNTVNVYVVKGDTLTLIDTGTKAEKTRQALHEQLRMLGYTIDDIETVVLTHHHVDHSGLLDDFRRDVRVIGHPLNEPWISQDPIFLKKFEQFFMKLAPTLGIPEVILQQGLSLQSTLSYSCKRSLTNHVKEGQFMDGLPQFQVIETPGHASTHISLYRESDGLLIGGDILLQRISSNPLLEPPYEGEERPRPLLQYNESLRRLADMPINRILTGHGEDVTAVKELVTERLHKQEKRARLVLSLLQRKPMTAYEVCVAIFPTLYDKQLMLTMSETVGQLDYLAHNQLITVDTVGNHQVYRSN